MTTGQAAHPQSTERNVIKLQKRKRHLLSQFEYPNFCEKDSVFDVYIIQPQIQSRPALATKQASVNLRKLKSHQASFPTTML